MNTSLILFLLFNIWNILTPSETRTCVCDYKFKDKTGLHTACQIPDSNGKLWCYITEIPTLRLSSTGGTYSSVLGVYKMTNMTYSERPVWKSTVRDRYLYYSGYWKLWVIYKHLSEMRRYVRSKEKYLPLPPQTGWQYYRNHFWRNDDSMTVIDPAQCSDGKYSRIFKDKKWSYKACDTILDDTAGHSFEMKPNTLIDVIPKMGPTFRIKFKLKVEKLLTSNKIQVFSYKSLYSIKDFLELTVTKYGESEYEISCLFGEKDGDNARNTRRAFIL